MSATAPVRERPSPPPAPRPARRASGGSGAGTLVAAAALLVTASLSLGRVYVGAGFWWPILGAIVAALTVGWASRRLRLGPWAALTLSTLCWGWYVALAFLPSTLALGILPTPQTWSEGAALWSRGWQLVLLRPAPTFAEPGLLLLTVAGVWAVTYVVDTLVFLLHAPLAAIVVSLVLWIVPLTLSPGADTSWIHFVPFLAAIAALLLAAAGDEVARFGRVIAPPGGGIGHTWRGTPLAVGLAVAAITLGALTAERLPDLGDRPWLQLRGMGNTAVATNPIVGMRQRLVSQNSSTVFTVRTTRPIYLRTTALDVYSEDEEWTNAGINARPVRDVVPFGVPIPYGQQVPVEVEVVNLPEAVLVPLPYQTVRVMGPVAARLHYDRSLATFTLDEGTTLAAGDRYAAIAQIPSPTPEQLDAAPVGGEDPALIALPDNIPPEVAALARQIVDDAGATTRYRQALAIQEELRTWTYSLDVPSGHSRGAMASFLETRTGYCEQFAGTMAVMLRTLGIPARVAVGFTPGVPAEPTTDRQIRSFVVSQANAHAWVEVLFPDLGWVAFEPTPRSDGNVLVPTATNLAPDQTAAELTPLNTAEPDSEAVAMDPEPASPPLEASAPDASPSSRDDRDTPMSSPRAWRYVLAVLAAVLVVGGAGSVGVRQLRARAARRPPAQRVLRAMQRIRVLGRALGVPATPSTTDAEYLGHLVEARGVQAARAPAATLLHCAEQARWARTLPAQAAHQAEDAAGELERLLLQPLPPPRRALATLSRLAQTAAARVAHAARRLAGSPGSGGSGGRSGGAVRGAGQVRGSVSPPWRSCR